MAGLNEHVSLNDLAATVVAQDPEIRAQLKGLVSDLIGHMRYTMRHGDPASKIALTKQVLPSLLGSIKKVEGEAGDAEARDAYERMIATLRGDAPVADMPPQLPTATVDAAVASAVASAVANHV